MLGMTTRDIVGSDFEFNYYLAQNLTLFLAPRASLTDDTVCTAIADALMNDKVSVDCGNEVADIGTSVERNVYFHCRVIPMTCFHTAVFASRKFPTIFRIVGF